MITAGVAEILNGYSLKTILRKVQGEKQTAAASDAYDDSYLGKRECACFLLKGKDALWDTSELFWGQWKQPSGNLINTQAHVFFCGCYVNLDPLTHSLGAESAATDNFSIRDDAA